jgi:DNA-binding GntR family transcriptional regulator
MYMASAVKTIDHVHGKRATDLVGLLLVDILSGRYPGGSWLVEQDLARRFRMSRTPVREAIRQLTSFGVVSMHPNRGAMVEPFGLEDLRDIYRIRRLLECEATRLASGRIDRGELLIMQQQTQELLRKASAAPRWARAQNELDQFFHARIAQGSGSPRLAMEIARYARLIAAVRASLRHEFSARSGALQEHLRVIAAMLHNDPDQAALAMGWHIDQTAEAAVRLFTR